MKTPYKRGRIWWAKVRLEPSEPISYFSTHRTDKQSALKVIDERFLEMQRERAGLIAPKIQREAANVLLVEHLSEFLDVQSAKGRDSTRLKNVQGQLQALFDFCGWKYPRDINAASFEAWRARQKIKFKTQNEYLCSANVFCKWLVKARRIASNPLADVERLSQRGQEKRERRSFSPDELKRLVVAAGRRGIVYLVAAYTGLRRKELRRLEWRDIFLDSEPPYLRGREVDTKNRKEAILYLGLEVAEALRRHRPHDAKPGAKVFPRMVPEMELMRKHLELAGIPYVDARGRHADFHALRVTFVTRMAHSGAAPIVVKEAARHSDFRQTMVYMDTAKLPVAEAMRALPPLGLSPGLSPRSVFSSPAASNEVRTEGKAADCQTLENQRFVSDCPPQSKTFNSLKVAHPSGFEPETF